MQLSRKGREASVLVERVGHAMVVTINRPHVLNAVDTEVARLLGAAIEEATDDDAVWAVVLTGAGDRAFCAGADLKAMARGEVTTAPDHAEWGFAGFVDHFTPVPVIAAVDGFALGGGTELCLASDVVVASSRSHFGLPEVRRGIIAGGGGLLRLPEQIAPKLAMQLIFTGEEIGATEAARFGLVNEVVDPGQSLDRALAIAAAICENAPLAVQASKRVAYGRDASGAAPAAERWAHSRAERAFIGATSDAREGAIAFVEKRRPVWRGR